MHVFALCAYHRLWCDYHILYAALNVVKLQQIMWATAAENTILRCIDRNNNQQMWIVLNLFVSKGAFVWMYVVMWTWSSDIYTISRVRIVDKPELRVYLHRFRSVFSVYLLFSQLFSSCHFLFFHSFFNFNFLFFWFFFFMFFSAFDLIHHANVHWTTNVFSKHILCACMCVCVCPVWLRGNGTFRTNQFNYLWSIVLAIPEL